ncbi:MAG: hypothetical protein V2A79_11515 [Planctomycetota bacterium]
MVAGLILAVTGLFILTAAASHANAWAWWAHVICAALVPTGYILHRAVSYVQPRPVNYPIFGAALASILIVLVAGYGFTHREVVLTQEARMARGADWGPGSKSRNLRDYVKGAFVPAGYVSPESPFFPSAATTASGDQFS